MFRDGGDWEMVALKGPSYNYPDSNVISGTFPYKPSDVEGADKIVPPQMKNLFKHILVRMDAHHYGWDDHKRMIRTYNELSADIVNHASECDIRMACTFDTTVGQESVKLRFEWKQETDFPNLIELGEARRRKRDELAKSPDEYAKLLYARIEAKPKGHIGGAGSGLILLADDADKYEQHQATGTGLRDCWLEVTLNKKSEKKD